MKYKGKKWAMSEVIWPYFREQSFGLCGFIEDNLGENYPTLRFIRNAMQNEVLNENIYL